MSSKTFTVGLISSWFLYTVEPPNKGHFGGNNFVPCKEAVPVSTVK